MIKNALSSTVVDLPFQRMDLAKAFSAKPPKLDYVLSGLIAGSIGLLIAPGGVGKSTLVNYIAAHISSGYDPLGFGPTKIGEVLLLAAEDPEIILWHRSNELGKNMHQQQRDLMIRNCTISCCIGDSIDLLDGGKTTNRLIQAGYGKRLIIIDTLSEFHSGNENDERDATDIMRQIALVGHETGAAIICVHHTTKLSQINKQGSDQNASRGSSAFVNKARWVANLELDKLIIKLGLSKVNYGSKSMLILKMQHGDNGTLKPLNNLQPTHKLPFNNKVKHGNF